MKKQEETINSITEFLINKKTRATLLYKRNNRIVEVQHMNLTVLDKSIYEILEGAIDKWYWTEPIKDDNPDNPEDSLKPGDKE